MRAFWLAWLVTIPTIVVLEGLASLAATQLGVKPSLGLVAAGGGIALCCFPLQAWLWDRWDSG